MNKENLSALPYALVGMVKGLGRLAVNEAAHHTTRVMRRILGGGLELNFDDLAQEELRSIEHGYPAYKGGKDAES